MTIRGGLIGATITAFLSWNTGKYNKIGIALRRFKFVRHFISLKKISGLPMMTQYDEPQLNSVASNFFCYSGEPGIGKSYHFQNLVSKESLIRPALYLSFKTVGKDTNFENDVAEQISFGEDGTMIIAEIIRAVKRIGRINRNPERFWLKYLMLNSGFLAAEAGVYFSNWDAMYGMLGLSGVIFGHLYMIYFMQPFLIQSFRRTVPLIVMDDLNKIEQMNMLSEIVRFLKLIEDNAANIMLVSSDEETWSHLRK